MTDKEQIIIDGVNVLECEHYEYKSLKDCEMRYPESGDCEIGLLNYLFNGNLDIEKFCKDNPNCYFKQLKRKEQECEEQENKIKKLRKNLALEIETNTRYREALDELKEENEELNKRNNFLLQRLEVDDTDTSLVFKLQRELENSKSEFYHAVVTNVKLKNRNQQLDGAITKIKCYEQALDVIKSIVSSTLDCGEWIGQGDNKMENILDIINKVKDTTNET